MDLQVVLLLLCVGAGLTGIFGFLIWYIYTMSRTDRQGEQKQNKLRRSRLLKWIFGPLNGGKSLRFRGHFNNDNWL